MRNSYEVFILKIGFPPRATLILHSWGWVRRRSWYSITVQECLALVRHKECTVRPSQGSCRQSLVILWICIHECKSPQKVTKLCIDGEQSMVVRQLPCVNYNLGMVIPGESHRHYLLLEDCCGRLFSAPRRVQWLSKDILLLPSSRKGSTMRSGAVRSNMFTFTSFHALFNSPSDCDDNYWKNQLQKQLVALHVFVIVFRSDIDVVDIFMIVGRRDVVGRIVVVLLGARMLLLLLLRRRQQRRLSLTSFCQRRCQTMPNNVTSMVSLSKPCVISWQVEWQDDDNDDDDEYNMEDSWMILAWSAIYDDGSKDCETWDKEYSTSSKEVGYNTIPMIFHSV